MRRLYRMLLLVLALCLFLPLPTLVVVADSPLPQLKVRLFKAGKADCAIFRTADTTLMIDTAETDDVEDTVRYLREKQIETIDCLIITHFDKGHAGGAPGVLDAVKVSRVLIPDYPEQNESFFALMAALKAKGITPEKVIEPLSFTLGPLDVTVIPAEAARYQKDDDDNQSLVTSVTHGTTHYLWAADIMAPRMDELMASPEKLPHDVLLVPSHGRHPEGLDAFIKAVQPRLALITASLKNPPTEAVLEMLRAQDILTYVTVNGNITLTGDGDTVRVKQ